MTIDTSPRDLWHATDDELLRIRDRLALPLDVVSEVISYRAFEACSVPDSGGPA